MGMTNYSAGWDAGVSWAEANHYIRKGKKNCDGGILGKKLAQVSDGNGFAEGFAEGVKWFLGKK